MRGPVLRCRVSGRRSFQSQAERVKNFEESVWNEFGALAIKNKVVNLGQGFPDYVGPRSLLDATKTAIDQEIVQYTRSLGHPKLCQELGRLYSERFGYAVDWEREVQVTVGATEALYDVCQALLDPGDEAVMFEPFYDSYPGDVRLAGATPRYVSLTPKGTTANEWTAPSREEFDEVISDKTKMIFLNTPQNVPGKVWSEDELQVICDVAIKYDLIVVVDEVYELLCYDGTKHIHVAAMEGMKDRTITISSVGKSYSATGYKVGWTIASAPLIQSINCIHVHNSFCHATPLQEAVAVMLREFQDKKVYDEYVSSFVADMTQKRDFLAKTLREVGIEPVLPQGSYFMLGDVSSVDPAIYTKPEFRVDGAPNSKDYLFCRWLSSRGVGAIPPTPFFATAESKKAAEKYARFAFCKTDGVLEEGAQRLKKIFRS